MPEMCSLLRIYLAARGNTDVYVARLGCRKMVCLLFSGVQVTAGVLATFGCMAEKY